MSNDSNKIPDHVIRIAALFAAAVSDSPADQVIRDAKRFEEDAKRFEEYVRKGHKVKDDEK